ncbi:MAG: haloalkane dehalogenase [Actinomycetota bacterium]
MEALRTPDDRFVNLPGWPYAPHYTTIASGVSGDSTTLRIAHIDEGPRDSAATVLCMHGEPSWSYLYRKMIPVFVAAGHRVVAPDLIGFGRSDKPVERSDYTYERHVAWMSDWLTANDLSRLTLVCQDWGGLIGLRLVAAFPERFDRVVVANTFLPVGDRPPSDAFMAWRNYSQSVPEFKVGRIVEGGCARRPLAPEVVAAYDAPFPDDRFKAGARVFPTLVPISTDDPSSKANIAAWQVLERFDKPVLTAFSDADPVTKGGDRGFQQRVPGTSGQPHTTIVNAGHFLQEDAGEELAHVVNDFVARTPAN